MKFGDFLFPESKTPDDDFQAVNDALDEAELADSLGYDAVWLGEHHVDGACAYVDPSTFAAAVAARTRRVRIGYAVVQMALHHPVRLAEQVALLDNISHGRVMLGTGRGTAFNFYEYRTYGIDPKEADARLLEAEEIIVNAWTTENYVHDGRFWHVEVPVLRPKVRQQPHPPMVRGCASAGTVAEMARQGRPFLLVSQTDDATREKFDLYKETMSDAGYDDEAIARNLEDCWIWRNVVVADTDAEAQALGTAAYESMRDHISTIRGRLNRPDEQAAIAEQLRDPRHSVMHGVIAGSPETVCERIDQLNQMDVGGLIVHFRLGPLSREANEHSMRLFAEKVAPRFR